MLLNAFPLNDQQFNGDLEYADGLLLRIEKTIENRATFQGSLLQIEKTIVRAVEQPFTLLYISKIIESAAAPANTFFNRNGWEPIITVGSLTIRASDLTGGITVNKAEGDNTTASFTFILRPGLYDLYQYQGKNVKITIRTNITIYTIFNGKVDVPVINTIEEKLTLNCVADRRVLLNNLAAEEPYIGYYSASVLGQNADISDRITARMSTIPASLDFDSWNRYSVTSWTAKSTPDFSYGSSAVYRRDPQLSIDSSGQILNKVTINLEYGYQRHHARFSTFFWQHPYNPTNYQTGEGNICPFLQDAPTMPSKEMVINAADGAGWPVLPQSVFLGKTFKAGSYLCNGVWAQWSTSDLQTSTEAKTNADGSPAKDADGNTIMESQVSSLTDYSNYYTMYAQWTATKQFSQNLLERYTAVVQSPESIARYGAIPTEESYSYTGKDLFVDWEQDDAYRAAPTGAVVRTDNSSGSYFFNGDQDRNTFNNAYQCALNKAKTSILKTHRTTRITFQRPFTPLIELKHTVALTGKWIRGKGKCNRITHYLNISDNQQGIGGDFYTEISFLQYRGNTTVSETPLVPAAAPSDTVVPTQPGVILQTHLGQDPSTPQAASWNGYVGNIGIVQLSGGKVNRTRTNYQESFIVDTPDIPSAIRDQRVLTASGSYNINIPNDNTQYESYG